MQAGDYGRLFPPPALSGSGYKGCGRQRPLSAGTIQHPIKNSLPVFAAYVNTY